MPRDGSGHFLVPVGTDGVTDQTIDSGRYNAFVHDVETDLNTPRPISAGGTGANNAADAMTNLGGELANQGDVRNYDTFPFKNGSFFSSPGATSAPGPGNWVQGICYAAIGTTPTDFYLEARNIADDNIKYVRRKLGGVWQPWVRDDQLALDNSNLKVAKAGDTMTGGLMLDYASPVFTLNCPLGGITQIISERSGVPRWAMHMGNSTGESGGNTGTNFQLIRCNDAGVGIDVPLSITRNDGHLITNGYVPVNVNDLVNKAYVDGTGTTGLAGKVSKTGDTMTGPLNVGADLASVNGGNDTRVTLSTAAGSYGSLFAVNFANSAVKDLVINQYGGNVGIGTSTPGAKLDVNGGIKAAGNLVIGQYDWPTVFLNKNLNTGIQIVGAAGGNSRWTILPGDNTTEGGGNAGSDFVIQRFTDAGAYAGIPFFINRASGNVTLSGNLSVGGTIFAGGITATAQATATGVATKSPAGSNASVLLQDETGALKCYMNWDRASNTLVLNHISSPASINMNTAGKVTLGTGMAGRAGNNGAYDTNAHNFFWTGTAGQMWIDVTNFGTIQTVCDYRTKKDVAPLASTWSVVKELRPIVYTQAEFTPPAVIAEAAAKGEEATPLFTGDDEPQWGFLAHELQETLLPSAAHGYKDSPEDIQTPNTLCLIAALTRALQEAMARIEALENRAGATYATSR